MKNMTRLMIMMNLNFLSENQKVPFYKKGICSLLYSETSIHSSFMHEKLGTQILKVFGNRNVNR